MCEVDDTVLYGSEGLYRYAGVAVKEVEGNSRHYHVLCPVYSHHSTVFVPVDNEKLLAKIRQVLSAEEMEAMIKSMPEQETNWIEDEAVRKEEYRQTLAGGDRRELMRMIKTLYLQGQEQKKKGKKLHATDEHFFKEAEKILHEEFAHVLKMKREDVLPFLLRQLEPAADRFA